MTNMVAEAITDCPEALSQHYANAVIWPSGDLILTKQTKRCTLGLSDGLKLRKTRGRRGRNGLTPRGKRIVRSGGRLLENRWSKHLLSFITCTVPDLTDEELEHCVNEWGNIAHRFCEELKRELLRKGIKTQYVYVTEIQPERWNKEQRAYPHLHLVCRTRISRSHGWGVTTDFISRVWARIFQHHFERPLSMEASTQIASIKKSVANYLTKYFSKGLDSLNIPRDVSTEPLLPLAWYGLSRSLLGLVRTYTLEIPADRLEELCWQLVTCLALNKASCSVLSVIDERTGFMWPVALIAYIYSKSHLRQIYDRFCNCKYP